ncbi:HORMA domain [Orobanche gracilis]
MITEIARFIRTLEKMSEEAPNYESPFFSGWTKEEVSHQLAKLEVGDVNSKHSVLALMVKSVLHFCEDDNEGVQDDMGTGDDSMQKDGHYEIDVDAFQVDLSQGNPFAVTYVPVEDKEELLWVEELNCRRDTLELIHALSNFPDISVYYETADKLLKEEICVSSP